MPSSEELTFDMHPQLIMDVITRQAGTLQKAGLEGIMNSIDAGAGRIDIELNRTTLRITDDGRGFRDRDEIDNFFKTFGRPHTAAEQKRYGRFRMGRGQLFAFGRNVWQSGKFRMTVDVANRGLSWDLETLTQDFGGCEVVVQLYNKLSNVQLKEVDDALRLGAKYVSVPTFLNGEQFNKDPRQERWDHELEEADIRLRDRGDLHIYNMGILVLSRWRGWLGTSGDVVTKMPVKVNFARNDIMADCPVWKRIRRSLDTAATARNVRTTRMTDEVRERVAQQVQVRNPTGEDREAIMSAKARLRTLKIIMDVFGRAWSYNQICSQFNGRIAWVPAGSYDVRRAALVQEHKICLCVGSRALEVFNVSSLDALRDVYVREGLQVLSVVDYAAIARDVDSTRTLVPKKQWRPNERVVLHVLNKMAPWLLWGFPGPSAEKPGVRLITLGLCESERAWTDGCTYIAISQRCITETRLELGAWAEYGLCLLHEYCHDEETAADNSHPEDFYQLYHDWARSKNCLCNFVVESIRQLPASAAAEKKRLTKAHLRAQDVAERAEKVGTALSPP